uniref:Uncharacterized protein n=1 Tax=Alexandrium catenella TaxID=2925 RepID=A0A7S1WD37_ALECA
MVSAATYWASGLLCSSAGGEGAAPGGQLMGKARGSAVPAATRERREACRRMGCCFGYAGLLAGLIAAMSAEGRAPVQNAVHTAFTIAFFSLVLGAALLLTAASDLSSPLGHLRAMLALLLSVMMGTQLALFVLVNQYVRNGYGIPSSVYASTEYGILALLAALPMTWAGTALESDRHRAELSNGMDLRSRLPGYGGAKLSAGVVG